MKEIDDKTEQDYFITGCMAALDSDFNDTKKTDILNFLIYGEDEEKHLSALKSHHE